MIFLEVVLWSRKVECSRSFFRPLMETYSTIYGTAFATLQRCRVLTIKCAAHGTESHSFAACTDSRHDCGRIAI